jgi:hypothetical protein
MHSPHHLFLTFICIDAATVCLYSTYSRTNTHNSWFSSCKLVLATFPMSLVEVPSTLRTRSVSEFFTHSRSYSYALQSNTTELELSRFPTSSLATLASSTVPAVTAQRATNAMSPSTT